MPIRGRADVLQPRDTQQELKRAMGYAKMRDEDPTMHDRPFLHINGAGPKSAHATMQRLWEECLRSPDGVVHSAASEFIERLRERSPRRMELRLTDLQLALLNAEASDRPFGSRRHVLLVGPTSTGKSTVADMFLARPPLLNGSRRAALYIAPTRALTQAKWRELRELLAGTSLHDETVLSTGEDDADDWRLAHGKFLIACMVYEKANILFSRSERLMGRFGVVVVDEAHMLMDVQRGPGLEIALTKAIAQRRAQDERVRRDPADDRMQLVVISTEDSVSHEFSRFLSVPESLEGEGAPHVFRAKHRPIEVRHEVVVPGKPGEACICRPLVSFRTNEDRQLPDSTITEIGDRLRAALLPPEDGDAAGDVPRPELERQILAFLMGLIDDRRTGYRVLVFVPSKRWIERLARSLAAQRAESASVHEPRVDPASQRLIPVLDDMEDQALARDLHSFAVRGIFIHHAGIDASVRREIEMICGEHRTREQPSQILLATETLSYGVNLAIHDVVFLSFRFPMTTRQQQMERAPLSLSTFHNMAGRGGRLGKVEDELVRVYILLSGVDAPEELLRYYRTIEPVTSKLFVKDDREAVERLESPGGKPARGSPHLPIYGLSDPFVRGVLDALRHSNLTAGSETRVSRLEPQSEQSVLEFFLDSLYAEQFLRVHPAGSMEHERFSRAVSCVLEGCVGPPLDLIRRTEEVSRRYAITPRGEAVINTGVGVRSIVSLLTLVKKIRSVAKNVLMRSQVPGELYLIAILAQPEVYEPLVVRTPEFRRLGGPRASLGDLRAARDRAINLVSETLKQLGFHHKNEAPMMAHQLRLIFDSEVFDDVFQSQVPEIYLYGAAPTLIRFFSGVVAWLSGAELRASLTHIEKGSGAQGSGGGVTIEGWRKFTEQLGWRMIFLAKILSAEGGEAEPISPDEQRDLYILATRLRLGCPASAIPFFGQRAVAVTRRKVLSLITSGLTASEALSRELQSVQGFNREKLDALRGGLGRYAVNELRRTAAEMTLLDASTPLARAAQRLWQALASQIFPASVAGFLGARGDVLGFDAALREAHSGLFEDTSREGRRFTWMGVELRPGWRAAIGSGSVPPSWRPLGDFLKEQSWTGTLVLIAMPWAPPTREIPPGLAADFQALARDDRGIVLLSPAAHVSLLSALGCGFIDGDTLVRLFAASARTPEEAPFHFVGVREVWKALEGARHRIPSSVQERLSMHFEVQPATLNVPRPGPGPESGGRGSHPRRAALSRW